MHQGRAQAAFNRPTSAAISQSSKTLREALDGECYLIYSPVMSINIIDKVINLQTNNGEKANNGEKGEISSSSYASKHLESRYDNR